MERKILLFERGVAVLVISAWVLMLLIRRDDWMNEVGLWLYHWQTLVGASLALVGAWLTIKSIRYQLDQTERHEQQRLEREHRACRSTLPLTLSSLCQSLNELVVELDVRKAAIERREDDIDLVSFDFSQTLVDDLKSVIASTDEQAVTELLAELIRQIQVVIARCEAIGTPARRRAIGNRVQYIDDLIIQVSKTYAIAEALFPYSRSEAQSGPSSVPFQQAESFLMRNRIHDNGLRDRFRRMQQASEFVWPT